MAKKVVATLRKAKDQVKLIRAVRSPKTGAYTFKEEMLTKDEVAEIIKKK